ncbi:MAG TPA: hypothetical protein PLO61_01775 [Fimbriimonadaceae bacterium]|nr:hypothetical protein [Fimbriimonadaceae bacterium]HRJ32255.1 hypothetical protein [Fimbriimonadaceae bacterium]
MWTLALSAVLSSHLHSGDAHQHTPSCGCGAFLPAYDHREGLIADQNADPAPDSAAAPLDPRETRLSNARQLTFGGQNAEAYWNVEGTRLVYQARLPGFPDEQIFVMNADGSNKTLVSTGLGRCTCSYFSPDGEWIYFSSTHSRVEGPQPPIDMSKGYVWMVNPNFALYRTRTDDLRAAGNRRDRTTAEPVLRRRGYIAETTISPDGKFMTFTGDFDGDLEIYRADLDGSNLKKLTDEYGYDGGPFVSWDGKKIVYRRDTIDNRQEAEDYKALLKQDLVRPGKLEIWIMNADGTQKRQVTRLGAASFAPFLHPNGRQIIFSSNAGDPNRRDFDLWLVNVDGTGLKQITFTPEFDGFPMFSKDGKKLVWASNRNGKVRGETNVFVVDWKN